MRDAWPLLGRAEELDVVRLSLTGDDNRGVVIAGDAGVGKTRLAREMAATLGPDVMVQWATASNATAAIPFGAIAHLLRDFEVGGELDLLATLQQGIAALVDRAGEKALVLAVDDAQHLDGAAAALVHRVAASGAGRVLLTVRTGVRAPDPVTALWKDGLVERLELGPLSRTESETLVEAAVGGPVDRPSQRRFWDLSTGNPLYLRELVIGAIDANAFSVSDGVWSWTAEFRPSTRLTEILEARLARVSTAGRVVLDHLAWGEPLPFDALAAICPAESITEVERDGLVVVDRGNASEATLAHPLYGEIVREQTSMTDRRAVMTRLAAAMAPTVSSSRTTLLRVATWQLEGGQAHDPTFLAEAAQIANASFNTALAERLAQTALDAGGGFAASLALGKAMHLSARYQEADEVLAPLEREATTDQERVDVAIARYLALTGHGGMRPEYETVLLDAERRVTDAALRSFLRVHRAILLSLAGEVDAAIALVSPDSGVALDEASAVRAVPALGGAWTSLGKMDRAVELAMQMLEPAMRLSDKLSEAPFWVVSTQFLALVAGGRLYEAEQLLAAVEPVISTQYTPRPDVEGYLASARGLVALRSGRVATARQELRAALEVLRFAGQGRLAFPLAFLAEACALAGDREGALAAYEEAERRVERERTFEALVRRGRAWAAFAGGQRAIAVQRAIDAAYWAAAHRHHTEELLAWHDALRFGAGRQAATKIIERAPDVEGCLAPCLAAHAAAYLAHDAEALEAAAAGLEQLGANLLAAEVFVQASDAFRDRGLRSRTQRARTRAQVIANTCEGAHSPILSGLEEPESLTAREREVVNLAAEGLHANEIAERLYVSTRTVEGHLHRVYVKLGVSNRKELLRALGTSHLLDK